MPELRTRRREVWTTAAQMFSLIPVPAFPGVCSPWTHRRIYLVLEVLQSLATIHRGTADLSFFAEKLSQAVAEGWPPDCWREFLIPQLIIPDVDDDYLRIIALPWMAEDVFAP